MNDPAHASTGSSNSSPQQAPGLGSFFSRAIWIVPISALAIFLIVLSSEHVRLTESGGEIVGVLVFTALISIPSMVLRT
jgi:hypothetical protein